MTIPFVIDNQQRVSVKFFCTNMRGASSLTTIHDPPKLLRSIVVRLFTYPLLIVLLLLFSFRSGNIIS